MDNDAHEKTSEEQYDWKLNIFKIEDVTKGGWQIIKDTKKPDGNGIRIGVVGFYNKGKTFIFNKLANISLPSGIEVTTDFIAIKNVMLNDQYYVLIDSAGKGQPVNVQESNEHANRAAVEDLLDNVMAKLVDYFIIVLNDLTWQDQLFITKIADRYSRLPIKEKCKLIVIHNWYHVGVDNLNSHFEKYIQKNYRGARVKPPGTDFFYYQTKETFFESIPVYIDHFFILGEGRQDLNEFEQKSYEREANYNAKVFKFIKDTITYYFPDPLLGEKRNDIETTLLACFNSLGSKYLVPERVKNIITFDESNNNNNDNIIEIEGEKKNKEEIVPKFQLVDNAYRILPIEGYTYKPKSIPMSVMLSQYPSSLSIPFTQYEQKRYEKKDTWELICHLECPGLKFDEIEINTDETEFWMLKIQKEKHPYQLNTNFHQTVNDSINNPSYGKADIFIPLPGKFNANINNYKVFYENGILVMQIFHQANKTNGTPLNIKSRDYGPLIRQRIFDKSVELLFCETEEEKAVREKDFQLHEFQGEVAILQQSQQQLCKENAELKESEKKSEQNLKNLQEQIENLKKDLDDKNTTSYSTHIYRAILVLSVLLAFLVSYFKIIF